MDSTQQQPRCRIDGSALDRLLEDVIEEPLAGAVQSLDLGPASTLSGGDPGTARRRKSADATTNRVVVNRLRETTLQRSAAALLPLKVSQSPKLPER